MMGEWDAWLGREIRQADRLDPALARRWCATFDLDPPQDGAMPQGIHLCLCTPDAAQSALGEDGHPQRIDSDDSFFPPLPLPRRMWAGSDFEFFRPISIGGEIARTSRIASVKEKEGSTGKLGFVDVEHETETDGQLAVRERQILVYRGAVAADAAPTPPEPGEGRFAPGEWDVHREILPDARLLFRYSALTFNTHRIHYDYAYVREVERYRGLVVHGPLMASLLLQLAAYKLGENRLKTFSFRAVSPTVADEPLHLVMRQSEGGFELGTFAGDGRQVVKASATA